MSLAAVDTTNKNSSNGSSSEPSGFDTENSIFFYCFVLLIIPSVTCNVGLLIHYFFYQRKQPTRRLFTFTLVCLLIVSFFVTSIDVPFILIPQVQGTSYIASLQNPHSFCIFFTFSTVHSTSLSSGSFP